MPRRKNSIKTNIDISAEESIKSSKRVSNKESKQILIELEDMDQLVDYKDGDYILKIHRDELTQWDKLKIVLYLRDKLPVSDISELIQFNVQSTRRMFKLDRRALEARGINADKLYILIKEGVSFWSILPYIYHEGFINIVNNAKNIHDFTVKFKSFKSEGIPKRNVTIFNAAMSEFLKLYWSNDFKTFLRRGRVNLEINEPFIIKIKPIHAMFYIGEDNKIEITFWENDKDKPLDLLKYKEDSKENDKHE